MKDTKEAREAKVRARTKEWALSSVSKSDR